MSSQLLHAILVSHNTQQESIVPGWFFHTTLQYFKKYLRSKSMDWFLYDNGLRLERVKLAKN